MTEWVAIAIALGSLLVALRSFSRSGEANQIAADANQIADKALKIAEAEYAQRERERVARARLKALIEVINRQLGYDELMEIEATRATIRLRIVISNDGDRAAGATQVELASERGSRTRSSGGAMPGAVSSWRTRSGRRSRASAPSCGAGWKLSGST